MRIDSRATRHLQWARGRALLFWASVLADGPGGWSGRRKKTGVLCPGTPMGVRCARFVRWPVFTKCLAVIRAAAVRALYRNLMVERRGEGGARTALAPGRPSLLDAS